MGSLVKRVLDRARPTLAFLCGLGILGFGGMALAEESGDAPTLSGPADLDALVRAALVAEFGDAQILAWLGDETPRPDRLRAIRATSDLAEPEYALAPLVAIGIGRDPMLAPAAMLAVRRITEGLSLDALTLREFDPSELDAVREQLLEAADQDRIRPDLRRLAAESAEHLRQLSLPAGEPDE